MAVQFGAFVLDGPRRELRRHGVPVHLTPKAFDLLQLLVTEAPRVVTKGELHKRLWATTFVSDATLVGLVKELRRALDDRDAASPVIRTAHRVGYAFCLDVHAAAPGPPASAAVVPPRTLHWLVLHDRRVVLHEGENTVGRDPTSDVWLDAAGVSRRHARILIRGAEVIVEDLGSKNGTRLRDTVLDSTAALSDGDRMVFGTAACVYRASGAGMSTETRADAVPPE
jgi:DNA-binding winged helix-turn-helix (wHTH) protein